MSDEKCFKAQLKEVLQKRSAELSQRQTAATQDLYNHITLHLIDCVRTLKTLHHTTTCIIPLKKTFKMCHHTDKEPDCVDEKKLNEMLAPFKYGYLYEGKNEICIKIPESNES